VEQRVNMLFRKVVEEMVKGGEINITSKYTSLKAHDIPGDFRFVVIEKVLSTSSSLKFLERFTMAYYGILKTFSVPEEKGFGLDLSFVAVEKVPLIVDLPTDVYLKRLY
jgi:KUP system potassium uptake protein